MAEGSQVAIFDAQDLVCRGLERVLCDSPGWRVIAAVRSLTEFSDTDHRPDIVLYDPANSADACVADSAADLLGHPQARSTSSWTATPAAAPARCATG